MKMLLDCAECGKLCGEHHDPACGKRVVGHPQVVYDDCIGSDEQPTEIESALKCGIADLIHAATEGKGNRRNSKQSARELFLAATKLGVDCSDYKGEIDKFPA